VSGGAAHCYVHLPFCASRCGYCAFVVETGGPDRRDAYLRALLAEIDMRAGDLGALRTVYLGGGTPSLMGPRRIARLLERLGPHIVPGAEVSMEANPESVDAAALAAYRAAGVTRLSLGAQSFGERTLAVLGRRATPAQVRAAVAGAREAGFASVSVDLLFGVPGQTPAELEADLAAVTALGVNHVSWYELELKPGAALTLAGDELPGEDAAADAYERVVEGLEAAGHRWYETANFARPGHECRHSLAYWSAADYLGVGVGAVSTLRGERRRNAAGVDRYIAHLAAGRPPAYSVESLDDETRRRERWMLGLRLDRPLDLGWAGPPDHPDALRRLEAGGLLRRAGARVALTRRGRFLQNAVLQELMEYA
jgi:oxygen-independent coproporphyrinogen-3 oxidase